MREIKKGDKYICKTSDYEKEHFIKGNIYEVVFSTCQYVSFISENNDCYNITHKSLDKYFTDLQDNNIEVKKGDKFLCIIEKDLCIKGRTYEVIGKEGEFTVFNVGNNITSYITKFDLKYCFAKVQEVKGCKLVSERRQDFQNALSKEQEVNNIEVKDAEIVTPKHYNNENGTLYSIAEQRGWNTYLFDIVKRLERAEKKGEFSQDLEKSIAVIQLWQKEQTLKNK